MKSIKNITIKFELLLVLLATTLALPTLVFANSNNNAGNSIGKVVYVRGVATASTADASKPMRILGRKTKLYQHDIIDISKKSFAMIEMIDGTKMTLRPNTRLALDKYEFTPPPVNAQKNINTVDVSKPSKVSGGSVNALLHLIRGGFRSVSDKVAKLTNKNYRVKTSIATIGIRGTEFDARLCNGKCLDTPEAKKTSSTLTNKKLVGRVAFMRGTLSAQYKKETSRRLRSGSPLYENDRIVSSITGYAVLAFSDQSRITLTRNSEFYIRAFNYQAQQPAENKSIIELVRGGLRALTGLIAKTNRDKVQYKALTVTIGIRGTGFDLMCDGLCRDAVNTKGGMNVSVWKGKIALDLDGGEQLINKGQQFYIAGKSHPAKLLTNKPDAISAPRPDKVEVDHEDLFGADEYDINTHTEGLYVSLYDGFIELEDSNGNIKAIGAGEAIKATSEKGVKRLSNQPAFQTNDVIPRPAKFDAEFMNFLNFMNQESDSDNFEKCEVR